MAKLKTFQVCEIAKDTYAINEAGMAAMFLVVGEKRALLIDTGVGMTDLKSLIAQLTDLPYDVVLTHGHMDHAGGAAQFDQVYIHPADRAALSPIDYNAVADYVEKMIRQRLNFVRSNEILYLFTEDANARGALPHDGKN